MKFLSFAAGLAILATETLAMFDGIEHLDSDNWAEKVEGDKDNAWMVTFYADWCPYCKSFDPELEAAKNDARLEGKHIKFGAVDVMANRDLTKRYGIKRSPTIKMFGHDKATPDDYLGQRKQGDVLDYADEYANTHNFYHVPKVEEDSYRTDPYSNEDQYYEEPAPQDYYEEPAPQDYYEEPAKPHDHDVHVHVDPYHEEHHDHHDAHPQHYEEPAKPAAPSKPSYGPATYYYNVNAIVGDITKAH